MDSRIRTGLDHLIVVCGDVKPQDKAVVVADENTKEIGEWIYQVAKEKAASAELLVIAPLKIHGAEPPADVASKMLDADVIFGVTHMSMAHSKARKRASDRGARYLSLPQYSVEVVTGQALLADFREITATADWLKHKLDKAKSIRITTDKGTDVTSDIQGRLANSAPGWCYEKGAIASPPDAETNIAPVEDTTNGWIVVDGSIPAPHLGLLNEALRMKVENGKIVATAGEKADLHQALFESAKSEKAYVLGEIGIGLNPMAKLCGSMLEDEGCLGTVHFGFGSNATIGGNNDVSFHVDHVIKDATIFIDDEMIMSNGKLLWQEQ